VHELVNESHRDNANSYKANRVEEIESAVPDVALGEETIVLLPNAICPVIATHGPVGDETVGKQLDTCEVGGSGPVMEDWALGLGPPVGGGVVSEGPAVLRTKKGDLYLLESAHTNPFINVLGGVVSSAVAGCEDRCAVGPPQQLSGPTESALLCDFSSTTQKKKHVKSKGNKSTKTNLINNNLNLPLGKLLKLPGAIHADPSVIKKRKMQNKEANSVCVATQRESDSIHCSSFESHDLEDRNALISVEDSTGIELQVVLPCEGVGLVRDFQTGQSGVHMLPCDNEDEAEIVPSVGMICATREEEEAMKLMAIQQEIGVQFSGQAGDNLKRSIEFEKRDRDEKQLWEQSIGYQ
jgi:hypothetical protein